MSVQTRPFAPSSSVSVAGGAKSTISTKPTAPAMSTAAMGQVTNARILSMLNGTMAPR